jgi:hypothetical protein
VTVRLGSEAASDVLSAREWHDAQRPGLGEEFVQALEEVIDVIACLRTRRSTGPWRDQGVSEALQLPACIAKKSQHTPFDQPASTS